MTTPPKKAATPKKAPAKKPVAKKSVAKKPAAKKTATTKKTTAAKPSAPNKFGATRAAADKSLEFRDRAVSKAKSVANEGKAKTGDAIGNLSKMIENSARTIDENAGEKYGDYARSAADAVASFAEKLNSKDVDDIMEDARGFVKKSPAVAVGAAAAIGFVVARLIKSGMDKDDEA
ncbi:hypothetical protein [Parasphingorhabdus halotolerans]|uniref:Membrane-anchored ribosome-binding protein, inhibits growth in stationary phase, ElaB/YqjD/DUF883 family n=1 Tax=Parasphingorhabdus halotolerans TaxID=2725558 RepID=A0A6H2DHP3_9SPHN|nr:hypothetical protein [Parasphingorhabdus halotolerans]QJB68189.1 hypothetical protein HF685_01780 [Parasphingorhabdus halotolerans]